LKELRVAVKDVNDELPTFSESVYSEVISMSEKPGHPILHVSSCKGASEADLRYLCRRAKTAFSLVFLRR